VAAATASQAGTAQSSVNGTNSANNVLAPTAIGSGSLSSVTVNGSGNVAVADSESGGTAIAGALSLTTTNNSTNTDYARAIHGGRALAGQSVLNGQIGQLNNGNTNTATADGLDARAGAGQIGSNNVGNTTEATATGAGSVAQALEVTPV